jgi:parallel beta-helix repeat protein
MLAKVVEGIVVVILLCAGAAPAPAGTYTFYVATNGNDCWSGTQSAANAQRTDGPLRTLPAALQRSRHARRHESDAVRIFVRNGTYPLGEPLVLTEKDSKLVIAAFPHESPVISGQTVIGGWQHSRLNQNIWQTEIPDARNGKWVFHELFVNGRRKQRTRVPDQGFFRMVGSGVAGHPTELQFHPGDVQSNWAQAGDVELVTLAAWAQSRNQIREVIAPSNIVSLAGGAMANQSESNGRFYIENAPVELRPGQWHLDRGSGLLTYWPEAGEDVPNVTITAPHLYELVRITGETNHAAHNIAFRGITFADTDWRLEGGTDTDIQAAVETPGAVQAQFARDCAFERCVFQRLGGYALELDRGCERDKIIGNDMHDLGAGGIRVGETALDQAMHTPCGHHSITDNHIHDIGLVNAPGVGIFVLLSGQNRIAHNEVDHTYYSAISVGWSWGYAETPCRGNIVKYNYLHDIGQGMLSDMGGVYTLGVQPGTVVRNNLIHDVNISVYGGWGLYTDEGSSGIVLENNIVYRCQSAGFHQHYGRTNVIRNNIFALNRESQLMRTRIENHVVFILTNNIVYFDSGSLLGGRWGDDLEMDHNLYFDTRSRKGDNQTSGTLLAWQKRGHDLHSWFVDPVFKGPGRGDFRLWWNSPARRFGFRPIRMSGVGVRAKFRRP